MYCMRRKQIFSYSILITWIPVVLFIDYLTPLGIADGILYLPGIVYAMVFRNKKIIIIYAAACTAAVAGGIFLSPDAGVRWQIFMLNRIYAAFGIWLISFFVYARISQKEAIEKLGRMITMSAWNKQVNYNGQWLPVEEYLKKEFNITVSHGIDPESASKILRDIERQP